MQTAKFNSCLTLLAFFVGLAIPVATLAQTNPPQAPVVEGRNSKAEAPARHYPGGGTGLAKPVHQISVMVGAALDSGEEPNGGGFEHQAWKSPVGRIAYHYSFMAKRPVQLLVGGQLLVSRSVSEAMSGTNGRTSTFTTSRLDGAGSVGVGFSPNKGIVNLQGFLSIGSNLSQTRKLKSPGFTTDVKRSGNENDFPLFIALDLTASVDLTEHVRAMIGLNFVTESTSSLLMGAAYAF